MPKTYDIVIRFHSVSNLPVADLGKFSSDPYLKLKLGVSRKDLGKMGKVGVNTSSDDNNVEEDSVIMFRTPTHHQTLHPIFPPHIFWTVGNIPEHGFSINVICRDEDPANQDDGLGKTKVDFDNISSDWKQQHMKIELRRSKGGGSWRAFAFSPVVNIINGHRISKGRPVVDMSIEVLGETKDNASRVLPYTIGPAYFSKHFSQFAGLMAGIRAPSGQDDKPSTSGENKNGSNKPKYNFQANLLQLEGPVPPELNHPFVPSKFFIKKLFTGKILPHALHHHHRAIFSHDLKTVYGVIIQPGRDQEILDVSEQMSELSVDETTAQEGKANDSQPHATNEPQSKLRRLMKGGDVEGDPEFRAMELENPRPTEGQPCGNASLDKSERFLEMCGELLESGKVKKQVDPRGEDEEEDQTGGALFTYVVTTDGQMRWAEVGSGWAKEVGSKHCILSNGAKHVAFAGEFFVRRKPKKRSRRPSTSRTPSSPGQPALRSRNTKNRDESRDRKLDEAQANHDTQASKQQHLGDNLPDKDRSETESSHSSQGLPHPHSRTDSQRTLDDDLSSMFPDSKSRRNSEQTLTTGSNDRPKFQLWIDNDSGTYRPPESHIPAFRDWLRKQLPGLEINVSNCAGADGKKLEKMKELHVRRGRERGEVPGDPGDDVEGGDLVFSDSSSSSSSSEDEGDNSRGHKARGRGNKGGNLPDGVQQFAEKYGIRLM